MINTDCLQRADEIFLPDNVHHLLPVREATGGQLAVNHRPIDTDLELFFIIFSRENAALEVLMIVYLWSS